MIPVLTRGEWLEDHLDDPSVVVVEVDFHLPTSPSYLAGRIPGSHVRWWKDLCWHETERRFPDPAEMARRLGEMGVADTTTLVLAGDPVQFATYAFWVLSLTGLDHVATVLDGGLPAWRAEGRPTVVSTHPAATTGTVTPRAPDSTSMVGRDDVLAGLGRPGRVLVDLRSAQEYAGERVAPLTAPSDHGAERGGHIPGAVHLAHDRLLDGLDRFRSPEEIAGEFDAVGANKTADVVAYCRLSHRASLGWFAATHLAGRHNVRVYDGSWTEWGSIVGVPVER